MPVDASAVRRWLATVPTVAGLLWGARHPKRVVELLEQAARDEVAGGVARRRLDEMARWRKN